eukprot:m.484063 g.484063  ORF g.484063 m.484063 type:complete len:318 (+) comp67786_c0_seq1:2-955(+)
MLFGDTFGAGSLPGSGRKTDWRSNTLAVSTEVSGLQHGLGAARWATGGSGAARALLQGRHDTTGDSEVSVIPSTLWSNETHLHGWFASVQRFEGDTWVCNNASVATSAGDGTESDWVLHSDAVRWSNTSLFQQFAAVHFGDLGAFAKNTTEHAQQCGGLIEPERYMYVFATPCGREGPASLARVDLLSGGPTVQENYEYFSGVDGTGQPRWGLREEAAAQVLPPGVGELTVLWCGSIGRFVAMYTAPLSRIVARSSPCLWSGWSEDRLLVQQQPDGQTVYGGFSHPLLLQGQLLHFLVSKWQAYNTWLAQVNVSLLV